MKNIFAAKIAQIVKTKLVTTLATIIVVIATILTMVGAPKAHAENLTRLDQNLKPTTVEINRINDIRVNSICFTIKNCKAIAAAKELQSSSKPTLGIGHPAAQYCQLVGGKNIILTDSKRNQIDYCLFSDESMVDAWDLYYKHHPKR